MIRYKHGVIYDGINPVIIQALEAIEPIFNEYGLPIVVTSAFDGKHKNGSLHYQGLAVDVRTRHILENHLITILLRIKAVLRALDKRYQAIYEKTHLHIEFDRRVTK